MKQCAAIRYNTLGYNSEYIYHLNTQWSELRGSKYQNGLNWLIPMSINTIRIVFYIVISTSGHHFFVNSFAGGAIGRDRAIIYQQYEGLL